MAQDYQKIIQQTVTNGRGYNPITFSNKRCNSETALQATLARMLIPTSYSFSELEHQVNELLVLDNDLTALGLIDYVNTPEKVEKALTFKRLALRYMQNIADQSIKSAEREPKNQSIYLKKILLKSDRFRDLESLDSFIKTIDFNKKNIIKIG